MEFESTTILDIIGALDFRLTGGMKEGGFSACGWPSKYIPDMVRGYKSCHDGREDMIDGY